MNLVDEIHSGPYPPSEQERVEGVAHIAKQWSCWSNWELFHADPRRPLFQRQNDLLTPWGGPSADYVYRHARIDPSRTYIFRGHMNSCDEFVIAMRAGFMHQAVWGTITQHCASDHGIGKGDTFEIQIGGTPGSLPHIPIPDAATVLSFREFYFTWEETDPAVFTLECIDDDVDAPTPRLDDTVLAARMERAITSTEESIRFWNNYISEKRGLAPANTFAPTMRVSGGLELARYGFCFYDIAPDSALIVETDIPTARYWGFQLYETAWYDLLEPLDRLISTNHTDTHVSSDGKVRMVISHTDPGCANWLDAGGRREGLLTFRWFWASTDPSPTTKVIPVDDVWAHLPNDTPAFDPHERAERVRQRRRQLTWRFRT
jgi:hypothetical protein